MHPACPNKKQNHLQTACSDGPEKLLKTASLKRASLVHTVGRYRLGPEHVQNSTPETWSHPNTMRASGARALGGMFCNARVTHTAKLCTKNTGAKKQQCWDQKKLCWKCWAKKSVLDTQVTHWHTASRRCQPALLQTDRKPGWLDRKIMVLGNYLCLGV